ncbi:MAG: DUF4143 domain-containing protein [Terracidiphilus sp.]|jgi:predicted AAA+ superfamily ATPase
MLLPKLSESLAGRIEVLTLWPFSQGEIHGVRESFVDTSFSQKSVGWTRKTATVPRDELLETALAGGYPLAVARQSATRRDAWFQSYVMTMLQRDIRDLANIADVTAVPRLLSVVAAGAGCLLNFADLSRSIALPQTTLKRHFALLEGAFLVQLLRPWARNLGKRVIQTPKVYLNDTGLLAYLLDATVDRLKAEGDLAGGRCGEFRPHGVAQAVHMEHDSAGALLLAHGLRARGGCGFGRSRGQSRRSGSQSRRDPEQQRCARSAGPGNRCR